MKKLFALFTFTALAACSSNSNPITSALDDEEISSSSFAEEEQLSSSQMSSSQMSSSSSEDISSSSEEEIQSSTSTVSGSCVVDKLSYSVIQMTARTQPYIMLTRNRTYTETDNVICEVYTTFVTPQNDTLTKFSIIDIGAQAHIGVPINLTKSTINLVHVVRECNNGSINEVAEFDSDCVLTSF